MTPILFNHRLLIKVKNLSVDEFLSEFTQAQLEELIGSRLATIKENKIQLTVLGEQFLDFEKRRGVVEFNPLDYPQTK